MPETELISGKFYVLDIFANGFGGAAEPVAGPFETKEEAEAERVQLNIADDCIVRRKL